MGKQNKLKIINDPIYGFISIPHPLLYDIIEHRYFQRLRRISQMGLSNLVYPGATHTRFHHALGCLHLMQKAIGVLKYKQVAISEEEELGVYIAILLHDIGHGPFSHAMEHTIIEKVHHEELSVAFMELLNEEFDGALDLAIQIFKGKYHRPFLHQLISSQIDMDRMDYLKRDSFYSGVAEGSINSDRIIQMLNVANDCLVIEEKGIYSIEKFLVARRLMYWQCYFHKTSVGAEYILTKILKQAKQLVLEGTELWSSPSLKYFLEKPVNQSALSRETLEDFALLDDSDIWLVLKTWQFSEDELLAYLCKLIVNRKFLKVKKVPKDQLTIELDRYKKKIYRDIKPSLIDDLVFPIEVKNTAYQSNHQPIQIITKSGEVKDLLSFDECSHLKVLTEPAIKNFVCYPKINE